jgi:hypothetical protein
MAGHCVVARACRAILDLLYEESRSGLIINLDENAIRPFAVASGAKLEQKIKKATCRFRQIAFRLCDY